MNNKVLLVLVLLIGICWSLQKKLSQEEKQIFSSIVKRVLAKARANSNKALEDERENNGLTNRHRYKKTQIESDFRGPWHYADRIPRRLQKLLNMYNAAADREKPNGLTNRHLFKQAQIESDLVQIDTLKQALKRVLYKPPKSVVNRHKYKRTQIESDFRGLKRLADKLPKKLQKIMNGHKYNKVDIEEADALQQILNIATFKPKPKSRPPKKKKQILNRHVIHKAEIESDKQFISKLKNASIGKKIVDRHQISIVVLDKPIVKRNKSKTDAIPFKALLFAWFKSMNSKK